MTNKSILGLTGVVFISMLAVSCGTSYEMYSPEETNLQALTRITDNTDNRFDAPFGGDNGRGLFFGVRDRRGSSNIYGKENPTAAAMSPKTNGRNYFGAPTYCQATNQIAFVGVQEGAAVNDIFMMDATQGVAIRRLTNTPTEIEDWPCLSRDGRFIVFERCAVGAMNRDFQIWKQDLQSESPTVLTQGRMPSYSHDGRYIVFVRYTPDGNNTCLVVMDANGLGQTELTDAKMGYVTRPSFSPDDSKIIFQCHKRDKRDADLWVINRDGTGLTQLTFNKSQDSEPYWANDGNVYFSSDRGGRAGNYQIWRFRYNGGTVPFPPTPIIIHQEDQKQIQKEQPVYTGRTHTVQNGETLTQIARQYGVTAADLIRWNNLTTMTITPGMKLKVSAQ